MRLKLHSVYNWCIQVFSFIPLCLSAMMECGLTLMKSRMEISVKEFVRVPTDNAVLGVESSIDEC